MDAGLMQMQRRLTDFMNTLLKEGILDSQYLELHELQDESNPGFVVEVVSLFLTDTEKLLDDLSRDLTQQNVDFKRAHAQAHKLKGSSCSIGAPRVKGACIVFQNFCQEKNIRGCLRCLQQMKQEFVLLKSKLEPLSELEQQVEAAGGSIPKMQPINPSDRWQLRACFEEEEEEEEAFRSSS